MTNHDLPDLLTRKQVADYLGIAAGTLANWASAKRLHLPFVRVGRAIRYREADVAQFVAERTCVVAGEAQGD